VRAEAYQLGLINPTEILPDEMDLQCRHALVLSDAGRAIGCARITTDGHIDRMAVLPHEQQARMEVALIEILNDDRQQTRKRNPVVEIAEPLSHSSRIPS